MRWASAPRRCSRTPPCPGRRPPPPPPRGTTRRLSPR
uniref:Uncharacterized protein n=1 Tax=Arundo donax TaxID=35708 RepID=A0A0A9EM05_ARUDO